MVNHIASLDISKKKVIAFDMDGTLIDSTSIWRKIDQEIIMQLSNVNIPLEWLDNDFDYFMNNNLDGDIYAKYRNYIRNKYQLKVKEEEYTRLQDKIALSKMRKVRYKENASKLLLTFKQLGLKIVLTTSADLKDVNLFSKSKTICDELPFKNIFDGIITKDDITLSKPHPEIYYELLARWNVSADECLVFEDSLRGIQAAKNAGIEVVHVFDNASIKDLEIIKDVANYSINNYSDILEFIDPKQFVSKR